MTVRTMLVRMTIVCLTAAGLAACTYRGGDIGDPAVRKFHWFSFVEGEDIRAHCGPATPDRYRLVYNGIYQEQLRIYELDSVRRLLVANVTGDMNLGAFDADDLLAPWRAREARIPLDEAGWNRLVASFEQSGVFAPPPVGLSLPARSYFWTAAWCRDGRYGFTAWKHPSPAFDRLSFDEALFALDTTGVPVNTPKPVPFDPQWEDNARRGQVTDFTLKVSERGLVGPGIR